MMRDVVRDRPRGGLPARCPRRLLTAIICMTLASCAAGLRWVETNDWRHPWRWDASDVLTEAAAAQFADDALTAEGVLVLDRPRSAVFTDVSMWHLPPLKMRPEEVESGTAAAAEQSYEHQPAPNRFAPISLDRNAVCAAAHGALRGTAPDAIDDETIIWVAVLYDVDGDSQTLRMFEKIKHCGARIILFVDPVYAPVLYMDTTHVRIVRYDWDRLVEKMLPYSSRVRRLMATPAWKNLAGHIFGPQPTQATQMLYILRPWLMAYAAQLNPWGGGRFLWMDTYIKSAACVTTACDSVTTSAAMKAQLQSGFLLPMKRPQGAEVTVHDSRLPAIALLTYAGLSRSQQSALQLAAPDITGGSAAAIQCAMQWYTPVYSRVLQDALLPYDTGVFTIVRTVLGEHEVFARVDSPPASPDVAPQPCPLMEALAVADGVVL